MLRPFFVLLSFLGLVQLATAQEDASADFERQLAARVADRGVTVVHFWAPWCPNCRAELANNGWRDFLAVNPETKVIFVTVWNDQDGRSDLQRYGLRDQANFELLHHPNTSRSADTKVKQVLGLPLTWIPSTWVFREGKLRYALNYGEIRFPLLQQLIRDASQKWSHSAPAAPPAARASEVPAQR